MVYPSKYSSPLSADGVSNAIQNSLRFCNPHDPFSKDSINPRKLELPILSATACTFLHLNGGNFLFFFGGHNATKDRVTSDLIAVDVDALTWWYVKVQGGPINDRIDHSIVAIRNRIYVFGGKKEFDDKAPFYASYSIAEYSSDDGEWTWVVCDHPYPSHVPSQGYGGMAISVYDGKKILLSPGRLGGRESVCYPYPWFCLRMHILNCYRRELNSPMTN